MPSGTIPEAAEATAGRMPAATASEDGSCSGSMPGTARADLPTPFPDIPDGIGVSEPERWTVEIIERLPHDPDAFTQGLEIADGVMYESTGLYGQSSLRSVEPSTGEPELLRSLPDDLFGEGLTVVGDRIVQLTWRSGRALVHDRHTLELVCEHRYDGEGWGLCLMGEALWMSDGSDRLVKRDPASFEPIAEVTVVRPGSDAPVKNLNELECIGNRVLANVWQTDELLLIDVGGDGGDAEASVSAVVDASPLAEDALRSASDAGDQTDGAHGPADVLNGVADPRDGSGSLWMTGKLWPYLYRVRLVPDR